MMAPNCQFIVKAAAVLPPASAPAPAANNIKQQQQQQVYHDDYGQHHHAAAKATCSPRNLMTALCFVDRGFHINIIRRRNPLCFQICYFLSLSILGFLLLKLLPSRSPTLALGDAFFTSVSAVTVSSMSTVEMEAFSDSQLVVLTVLMLAGGEVFITSFLGLLEEKMKKKKHEAGSSSSLMELEKGLSSLSAATTADNNVNNNGLGFVAMMVYHVAANLLGTLSVLAYVLAVPSARVVLDEKGIRAGTFAVFTAVSSFANCGFIPTNENMVVFKNNSGLLLILILLILAGNTLFPPCLRVAVWALGKLTGKPKLHHHILKISDNDVHKSDSDHSNNNNSSAEKLLLPSGSRCVYLALTVVALILVQLVLFCSTEWNSGGLSGMTPYQKFVGALFQSVNTRHAGESIVSLFDVSPAILVLYAVMMYLPSSTTFLPVEEEQDHEEEQRFNGNYGLQEIKNNSGESGDSKSRQWQVLLYWRRRKNLLAMSHLSYLCIFTIIICITEREKMRDDPLNFNAFNVMFEVISAYGNVGLSTGYSCHRRLKPVPAGGSCLDPSYGFVGAWSTQGKLVLVLVMLFGRLKKLTNIGGGRAWRLR